MGLQGAQTDEERYRPFSPGWWTGDGRLRRLMGSEAGEGNGTAYGTCTGTDDGWWHQIGDAGERMERILTLGEPFRRIGYEFSGGLRSGYVVGLKYVFICFY